MAPLPATKENIALMRTLFVSREDRYGVQWHHSGRTGYRAVREDIADDVIARHLRGEITVGTYAKVPGRCKWLAFDFDDMDLSSVRMVKKAFWQRGVRSYTEFSGRKGWHLWVFLPDPEENRVLRRIADTVLEMSGLDDVEVFPKQDVVSRDHPGNLIKLPLGLHRATGRKCLFVDDGGQAHRDQFEMLRNVERTSLDCLQEGFPVEIQTVHESKSVRPATTPPMIKPCVRRLIREGAPEGYRNRGGFLIASEMRRIGTHRTAAAGVLAAWNERNTPPLMRPELARILESAYAPEAPYEFGCNWSGLLAEIMPEFCVGKENYLYLDVLFELNGNRENHG